MNKIIDVATGEVKVGRNSQVLVSNAIGSCVAVVALDAERNVGGIAHVMLAGRAPDREKVKTKYAFDAIRALFRKMRVTDTAGRDVKVFIAGGGNVLKLKDDTLCAGNIRSTVELLESRGIRIEKKAVGGTQRRRVRLDIRNRTVHWSEGNSIHENIWKMDRHGSSIHDNIWKTDRQETIREV